VEMRRKRKMNKERNKETKEVCGCQTGNDESSWETGQKFL